MHTHKHTIRATKRDAKTPNSAKLPGASININIPMMGVTLIGFADNTPAPGRLFRAVSSSGRKPQPRVYRPAPRIRPLRPPARPPAHAFRAHGVGYSKSPRNVSLSSVFGAPSIYSCLGDFEWFTINNRRIQDTSVTLLFPYGQEDRHVYRTLLNS